MMMLADRDEQLVVLRNRQRSIAAGHGSDHECVEIVGGWRRSNLRMRLECDQRRLTVEAQRFFIAMNCSQDDNESVARGRHGERHRTIQRQTHTAGREGNARADADRAAVRGDVKAPRNVTQPERIANVGYGLAQSILKVLQMFRRDAQTIEKLCTCIISHDVLRKSLAAGGGL
jgi:hypothetical protein